MKRILTATLSLLVIFPLAVFAAGSDTSKPTIGSLITSLTATILRPLIFVAFTVALGFFFWGMIIYIKSLGNEKEKEGGKSLMIWGIVALFVMVSVWGLVNLIGETLNLDKTVPGTIVLPGSGSNGSSDSNDYNPFLNT